MGRIRTKTGGIPYARYQLQRAILENALENNYTSEEYESAIKFFRGCAFCGAPEVHRMDHLIPVRKMGILSEIMSYQHARSVMTQKDKRNTMNGYEVLVLHDL